VRISFLCGPVDLPTAVCSCAMLHQGPRSSLACGPPQRPVSVQPASLLTEPTPLLEMPSPFESSEGHGDGPAGRRKNNIIVVSGTSRLARAHEARITAGWTSAADGRVRAQGNRVQHGGRARGKRASRHLLVRARLRGSGAHDEVCNSPVRELSTGRAAARASKRERRISDWHWEI
jgi:hypothetical protein